MTPKHEAILKLVEDELDKGGREASLALEHGMVPIEGSQKMFLDGSITIMIQITPTQIWRGLKH